MHIYKHMYIYIYKYRESEYIAHAGDCICLYIMAVHTGAVRVYVHQYTNIADTAAPLGHGVIYSLLIYKYCVP